MRSRTEPPGRVTEHANIPTKDRASLDAPSFALIAVYAALSAGGLATALFVGWYISVHLRELQEVIPQAYYILLLILGLAAAAFLFGAMRSTATVQGRQLGIAFDVGGPAAGALLVIVGGFWLTRAPPTFDLTVRLSGPEVRSDIANSWIVVDLGQLHPRISPDQQGDATQKQVGENHRHDPVRLQLESKQYRLSNPNKTYTIPSDNVLRVDVERIPPALPGSDHILFWWAGDGPKPRIGDITADSSGAVGYAEGIDGRAFDFSGTGFLEAAASKLPIGSKDRTIELWFLPTSLPQDLRKQMIFLCYGAIAKDSEQICLLYSKEFGIGASNFGQGNTRPGEVFINQWHHLALTSYSSRSTTYFDGQQYSQLDWTLNTATNSMLYIGGLPNAEIQKLAARGVDAGNFWGRIQDVKIYDVALGGDAIAAIFNEKKDKHPDLVK